MWTPVRSVRINVPASRLHGGTEAELSGGQRPESTLDGEAIGADDQGQREGERTSQGSTEKVPPREHREGTNTEHMRTRDPRGSLPGSGGLLVWQGTAL